MSRELTEDQLQRFRLAFLRYEKNGNGIDCDCITEALRELNQNPTQKEVDDAIDECQENNQINDDRTIEFEEFVHLHNRLHKSKQQNVDDLRNAFMCFDIDGNGHLNRQEIKRMLTDMGDEPLREGEVDAFLEKFDANEDGIVSYDEIISVLCEEQDETEQIEIT